MAFSGFMLEASGSGSGVPDAAPSATPEARHSIQMLSGCEGHIVILVLVFSELNIIENIETNGINCEGFCGIVLYSRKLRPPLGDPRV